MKKVYKLDDCESVWICGKNVCEKGIKCDGEVYRIKDDGTREWIGTGAELAKLGLTLSSLL